MLIKILLFLNIIEVSSYQYRFYKDSKNHLYPGWSTWLNYSSSEKELKYELESNYPGIFQTRKLYTFK